MRVFRGRMARMRLNWTKVGLKGDQGPAQLRRSAGLNWTKVGLKARYAMRLANEMRSLNWTKVGLKGY